MVNNKSLENGKDSSKSNNYESLSEIIKEFIPLVIKRNIDGMHALENQTLELTITADSKDYASFCIVMYGLRKMIDKPHIYSNQVWKKAQDTILNQLNDCSFMLKAKNIDEFRKTVIDIENLIREKDKELGHYINQVIDDARIKLASSAYAYGLSASQASELFSIPKDQLMSFIGITKMPDEDPMYKSINERIHLLDLEKK